MLSNLSHCADDLIECVSTRACVYVNAVKILIVLMVIAYCLCMNKAYAHGHTARLCVMCVCVHEQGVAHSDCCKVMHACVRVCVLTCIRCDVLIPVFLICVK